MYSDMLTADRLKIALLFFTLAMLATNSCTLKRSPIPPGTIPQIDTVTPEQQEYGQRLMEDLCEDYKHDCSHERFDELISVFDHLTMVAAVDHLPWHLHLFDEPDIVDVRAVYGNYIFIWSGFLDVTESEDEIAAMLAQELAHVLARHTDPVQFNVWSDIFFETASLASSLAVMYLSHGIIAVRGSGWMKWAYIEATDLDPLDRKYSEAHEREATAIALSIMARSKYSPDATVRFWDRLGQDQNLLSRSRRLYRKLPPQKRVALSTELLLELPAWGLQISGQQGSGIKGEVADPALFSVR
jgi:predicted Zn-dependent protease